MGKRAELCSRREAAIASAQARLDALRGSAADDRAVVAAMAEKARSTRPAVQEKVRVLRRKAGAAKAQITRFGGSSERQGKLELAQAELADAERWLEKLEQMIFREVNDSVGAELAKAEQALSDASRPLPHRRSKVYLLAAAAVLATIVTGGLAFNKLSFHTVAHGGEPLPMAICADGWESHSENRQGTCSHHGGVSLWLGGGYAPIGHKRELSRAGVVWATILTGAIGATGFVTFTRMDDFGTVPPLLDG